jgi:hypothetical protein
MAQTTAQRQAAWRASRATAGKDDTIVRRLDPDSEQWDSYFNATR